MINKINFFHSIIFFNVCIFFSAFEILRDNSFIIFSFFLILTIGISHGALDHEKGKKLLKTYKIKNTEVFYLSYVGVAIFVILIWIINPILLLSLFLIVAAYHFGKEDSDFIKTKNLSFLETFYFLKGSLVISAPLLFHAAETIEIFKILNFSINEYILSNSFLIPIVILSILSNFFLYRGNNNDLRSILFLDSFSILILNYFFNPILAFTIYFCFLHSIRHSLGLISEINKNLIKGFPIFLKKIIPLTLITAIMYLIVFYFISKIFGIDESVIKIIFIGLASLTFPHIILEYLVEKK